MKRAACLAWILVAALAACGKNDAGAAKGPDAGQSGKAVANKTVANKSATAKKHIEGVLPVVCGHTLPECGHCSEWIEIDGKNYEFANKLHGKDGKVLSMPFCGKKNLKAKVVGDLVDGKFVHKSIELQSAN